MQEPALDSPADIAHQQLLLGSPHIFLHHTGSLFVKLISHRSQSQSSAVKQQHNSRFGVSGSVSTLICGKVFHWNWYCSIPLFPHHLGVLLQAGDLWACLIFVLVSSVGSVTCFAHLHLSWVGGQLVKHKLILVYFGFGSNVEVSFLQAGTTFQSCFDLILKCSISFMQEYIQSCAAL